MKTILAVAICSALLSAPIAIGAERYITGAQIKDGTITADDLGGKLTHIKRAWITLPVDDTEQCDDSMPGVTCDALTGLGAAIYNRTMRCTTGNIVSGGWKPQYLDDGWNMDVYASYPSSDTTWTFALYNSGPDPIKLQVYVTCI